MGRGTLEMPPKPKEIETAMDGFSHHTTQTNSALAPSSNANAGPKYLNYEELRDQTGLSLSTLRRLVKAGRLPFFQPGGPRTRIIFPADVIERALRSLTVSPLPPESKLTLSSQNVQR